MSLRIVPSKQLSTSTTPGPSAPSAPGLYDTLRAGLNPSSSSSSSQSQKSSHPLETRLRAWTAQRAALQATLLRRQYGLAAPVQRSMELLSVERGGWDVMPGLYGGARSVHEDILTGRDCEVDGWEDVYTRDGVREVDVAAWGEGFVGW